MLHTSTGSPFTRKLPTGGNHDLPAIPGHTEGTRVDADDIAETLEEDEDRLEHRGPSGTRDVGQKGGRRRISGRGCIGKATRWP